LRGQTCRVAEFPDGLLDGFVAGKPRRQQLFQPVLHVSPKLFRHLLPLLRRDPQQAAKESEVGVEFLLGHGREDQSTND
jgi:hypothetical protein